MGAGPKGSALFLWENRHLRLSKIAAQRILAAEAEGKLSNLKGAGKAAPDRGGGDHADAVGLRMMAEAGALPEEMRLKKELAEARRVLAVAKGDAARKAASSVVADLEIRLSIQEEARRRFDRY